MNKNESRGHTSQIEMARLPFSLHRTKQIVMDRTTRKTKKRLIDSVAISIQL